MNIIVREANAGDFPAMIEIWNEVVEEGNAFPQEECLTLQTGRTFFNQQAYCGVAQDLKSEKLHGFYIIHPNNVGRCSHICNAGYGVWGQSRGMGIGEMLVKDSLVQAKRCGFKILQFNAVVAQNTQARHLYERLGFEQLGIIPDGFRMKDGHFEDIFLYYMTL